MTLEMLTCEREGALIYWRGWSDLELHFAPANTKRVPEHWRRFAQRQSPLSQGQRLAVNPANAMLGYLYTLLAAEARIGCLTVGLSPTLGIVHVDYRHRDFFCLDLIEAVRPAVDTYLLDLIASRVFRAEDFYETRRGACRILAPLTHTLAKTTADWARLFAPVYEHAAHLLCNTSGSRMDTLPTPLKFNQLRAVSADWRTGQDATRVPEGYTSVIEVWEILYYLTEIFELAARLSLSTAGEDVMVIATTLEGLEVRALTVGQSNRVPFMQPYRSTVPSLRRERKLTREQLIAEGKTAAVEMAREFFLRFGWKPSVEQLLDHQRELLDLHA